MRTAYSVSTSRACTVVQLQPPSYYYKAISDPEELALRHRLRELAAVRVRFGYRRLTIMLRREGWRTTSVHETESNDSDNTV